MVEGALKLARKGFAVHVDPDRQEFTVELPTWSQRMRAHVSADSLGASDRVLGSSFEGSVSASDCERFSWAVKSTLWSKIVHLDVFVDRIELHAEIHGRGNVDAIRFFDVVPDAQFEPHFAPTKHFNDKGYTDVRAYSQGSPIGFRSVFCPEPNSHGRQMLSPWEYGQVSVNSDLDYFGGNFVANPSLLCFAAGDESRGEWLSFGLAVDPGMYLFSEYEYLGGADFALRINSWGALDVDSTVRTPRMVISPGRTPFDAIEGYVRSLRKTGMVPRASMQQEAWWQRPILCGWGHQCYQADLFRVRSSPERPADNAAYTLCTQATYREIIERLDQADVPWGTLVIDARWFQVGGMKQVDVGRWPDLRGFIAEQHRRGRRVLLWWSPWDAEGIAADQCVRFDPMATGGRVNRPGRLAKFGEPTPGKKLAVDVTLPPVRERIRQQVQALLSPVGFDADGLKIDHVSAAPGIYGMSFPDGSGRLFGIEAARDCLALIYAAAKEAKQDALVIGQSPNPYFADVQDMLRLGDIYSPHQHSVVAEMERRARLARIAEPGWLIDTDGWPMPSLSAWREYARAQPDLGVPSLYYATHLDTTGEAFGPRDYALIRRAWRRGA